MSDSGILKWKFDISAFRLIGRDLITDRITALFELVKNSYDANATEVTVIFKNVGKKSPNSSITIIDNGIGMSFTDIRDKWMVIGTSNKRRNPVSPEPFSRRCVGEKGIGRFAVDKLGDAVEITTKKDGEDRWLKVYIDWSKYYKEANESEKTQLFTEIENQYAYTQINTSRTSGTTLDIIATRDTWSKSDIIRFLRESAKIVSPFEQLQYPFRIHVIAEEYDLDAWSEEFKIDATDLATISGHISFNEAKQECLLFNPKTGEIEVTERDLPAFGGVSMQLYYFDAKARNAFRKKYPNAQIDGVKIYRDGVITTPFAEREDDSDKKRDILGIDKRMWVSLFDKINTREIIGIVNITKDGNPGIIDATNRQDFSDTPEYRALKEFILDQIYAFDEYKVYVRHHGMSAQTRRIQKVGDNVGTLVQNIDKIIEQNPEQAEQLNPLKELALVVGKGIDSAVKEQKDVEEERARHESMYMRIMSRQEDAINATHAVKTSMGKIHRQALFFYNRFPNDLFNEYFSLYSKQIYQEMVNLDRATDEIFNYSKLNLPFIDINIKELVEYLLGTYKERFAAEGITCETNIEDNLIINCNEMFFYDIVQNITDNAIKAMHNSAVKKYKCTISASDDKLIMNFSDTGCGIPTEKREWVFGIYNTTTAEQGGGGIGLYAVRLRVNALKGNVSVIDSEFAPLGTTIHIELPFKK